ncbi:MAG: hypothetical protein AAFR84_15895 [Pseudomonadota bacterium]
MRQRTIGMTTGAVILTFAAAAWAAALPATQRYGETFVTYAQVDRPDGSFRRMLTTPDALDDVVAGMPVPDGTRILMETWREPETLGTVFHKHKIDGRWEYGSFAGNGAVNLSTRPQASCLSCHAGAAETDFTYTFPALVAAPTVGMSTHFCDRGGRSPCSADVYAVPK